MIAISGDHYFLIVPFGFLLINFLCIFVHELGHLLAGRAVGLRFHGVQIDPIRLRLDSGRWTFRMRPRLFRGHAHMSLDRICRVRPRLVVFVLGGPVASLFFGVSAFAVGEILHSRYGASATSTFLDFFGFGSFVVGVIAFVCRRGWLSDGALLRALLFSKEEATQLVASYALSIARGPSVITPIFLKRWFRLASKQARFEAQNYCANWLKYLEETDPDRGALYLESCLALSAPMADKQRDVLMAEAAFFLAYHRRDLNKAENWMKQLTFPEELDPLTQIRVQIALARGRSEIAVALRLFDSALALLLQYEDTPARQRNLTEWTKWREEVEPIIQVPA
jgi:hypothetical protein